MRGIEVELWVFDLVKVKAEEVPAFDDPRQDLRRSEVARENEIRTETRERVVHGVDVRTRDVHPAERVRVATLRLEPRKRKATLGLVGSPKRKCLHHRPAVVHASRVFHQLYRTRLLEAFAP